MCTLVWLFPVLFLMNLGFELGSLELENKAFGRRCNAKTALAEVGLLSVALEAALKFDDFSV